MTDERMPLAGGRQTPGVVRIGDTVRRPRRAGDDYAVEVLRHLERVGFEGAPRVRDADDDGELVLSYLEGETVPLSPFRIGEARAASAARLIRRFHDATAGSSVAAGAEVVRHGDLGPHNIVFRGEEAVGIIDWDEDLRPGTRIDDLAHAAWCCADLVDPLVPVTEQARLLDVVCRAYGGVDRGEVLDELAARFDRAIAQHRAADRRDAARVFEEMRHELDSTRTALC